MSAAISSFSSINHSSRLYTQYLLYFQLLTLYENKVKSKDIYNSNSTCLLEDHDKSLNERARTRWPQYYLRGLTGAWMFSKGMHTLAYYSLEAPPYPAQRGSAPPDHLLFWNVCIVSCVFRQDDIGPPIIGYSVAREKSPVIGPLSDASIRLA